jgi:hypothetical protein
VQLAEYDIKDAAGGTGYTLNIKSFIKKYVKKV